MSERYQASSVRAFTLIELLVVISIITLLVAILLPVLANARKAARSVKCLNNVRQLGVVTRMYSDDWRNWLPGVANDGPPNPVYWHQRLSKNDYYVKAPTNVDDRNNMFTCPETLSRRWPQDYAMNRHITRTQSSYFSQWRRFDEIIPATRVALIMERVNDINETSSPRNSFDFTINPYYYTADWQLLSDRHGRGFGPFANQATPGNGTTAQTAFVDLHAKTQAYDNTVNGIPYQRGTASTKNPWWYSTWVHDNNWW